MSNDQDEETAPTSGSGAESVETTAPSTLLETRASTLMQVGVEMDEARQEQMVFALAAAKRQTGASFLGDFAGALLQHAPDAQAQLFQDVFAAFISEFRRDGYFVEVGTGDGKVISNTFFLEKKLGWSGLVVEPNPTLLPALKQNRACTISTNCVYDVSGRTVTFMCTATPEFSRVRDGNADLHNDRRAEEFVEIDVVSVSLGDLLDKYDCPATIDYLSLDVEGPEFDILQTFDFSSYKINCITVEHNWTHSRQQIYELLTDHGYIRVFEHLSQWDDWYVRRDLLMRNAAAAAIIQAKDSSLSPPRDANIFVKWATLAIERGEPEIAEALCIQAIAIDDTNNAARRTLAATAALKGLRVLAIERWRDALARDRTDYWAHVGLAELLAARGVLSEAVEILREAVKLPGDVQHAQGMLEQFAPKLPSGQQA